MKRNQLDSPHTAAVSKSDSLPVKKRRREGVNLASANNIPSPIHMDEMNALTNNADELDGDNDAEHGDDDEIPLEDIAALAASDDFHDSSPHPNDQTYGHLHSFYNTELSSINEKKWNFMYSLLLGYIKSHGHGKMPVNYTVMGVTENNEERSYKVGLWLTNQRQLKCKGKLRADRVAKLQELVDCGHIEWGDALLPPQRMSIDDMSPQRAQGDLISEHVASIQSLEGNSVLLQSDYTNSNSTAAQSHPLNSNDSDEESEDEAVKSQRVTGANIPDMAHLHVAYPRVDIGRDNSDSNRWNMHEQKWETMFGLLLKYVDEHGHAKVPNMFKVDSPHDPNKNLNLGLWLGTQRQLFHKNNLRADRLAKLQTLADRGLLSWGETKEEKGDGSWMAHYNALLDYGKKHGHYNIKERESVTLAEGKVMMLGRWLDRMRSQYNKGKLTADRREKLQVLFDTGKLSSSIAADDDKRWLWYFEILKRWGDERDGNCNAPKNAAVTLEDGTVVHIGKWICKQRALQKGKSYQQALRPDRFNMLNELVKAGKLKWSFGLDCDVRWKMHYDALLMLGITRPGGDLNIGRSERVIGHNDISLRIGSWLNKQRENYFLGRLRPARKQLLQALVDVGRLSWEYDGEMPQTLVKSLEQKNHSSQNHIPHQQSMPVDVHTYSHHMLGESVSGDGTRSLAKTMNEELHMTSEHLIHGGQDDDEYSDDDEYDEEEDAHALQGAH